MPEVPDAPPEMATLMASALLQTRQRAVSWPRVQRYANRLRNGEVPPPIRVDEDNVIVDGNHRYVAGMLMGRLPQTTQWPSGHKRPTIPWSEVKVDAVDWGEET